MEPTGNHGAGGKGKRGKGHGAVDPNSAVGIITEVARQYGIPPKVALAIAQHESGLNPTAVGDNGTSFGLYQLHEGGELGSHSSSWADNARNNAETALRIVAEQRESHPDATWGEVAALAQRPADPSGYAQAVDGLLGAAEQSGDAVAYFARQAGGAANAIPAGGNDASALDQNISPQAIRQGLNSLGFASKLINSNKSLRQAFRKIISQQLDLGTARGQARATQILQNTAWFQNHTKAQRQYDELKYSDPKQWAEQIQQQRDSLHAEAVQMGLTVDPNELDHMAHMVARNGLTSDEVNQLLAHQFTYNPGGAYAGSIGQTLDSIRQQAQDYYVPVTDQQLQKYTRQVLGGNLDPSSLSDVFKQQALSMFPYLKEQLDAGQTVAQIADPYKQMMANTLELDSNGIKNNDPLLLQALQTKDQTGSLGLMPLYQFQQKLYDDPRWLQTDNARQSLVSVTGQVLQKMGLIS